MIIVIGASGTLGSRVTRLLKILHPEKPVLAITRKQKIKNCRNLSLDLKQVTKSANELRSYLEECGEPVEAIINCAGVCVNEEFSGQEISEIKEQIVVNLYSVIALNRVVLDFMKPGSHIINVSSLMGKIPSKDYSVYCAAKFGLVGFSEALRLELYDHQIRVSCVLPTLFKSKMTNGVSVPVLASPMKTKVIARDIIKILFNHSGVRTIGLQSKLSLFIERFFPTLNRKLCSHTNIF